MITDATTGAEAWETLAETYASTDGVDVMRLEAQFGRAMMKQQDQSIAQYIGYMKSLSNQLREVRVEIPARKIAHKILKGLPKRYESYKAILRARERAVNGGGGCLTTAGCRH